MDRPSTSRTNSSSSVKENDAKRKSRAPEPSKTNDSTNKRHRGSSGGPSNNNLDDNTAKREASALLSSTAANAREAPIDTVASMLARVDERGYRRDLLRDANGVLHGILMPATFPWNHPIEPVIKNLPVDIDELPALLSAGRDIDSGEFAGSSYQETKSHHGALEAASRSSDPGVIILTRRHPASTKHSSKLSDSSVLYEDSDKPGEAVLRIYEASQSMGTDEVETTQISLRLESTSSRSNILSHKKLDEAYGFLQIPAVLPSEVRRGRKVDAAEAATLQRRLGSYNHQDKGESTENSEPEEKRHGRVRRVWWSKESASGAKKQSASILTGKMAQDTARRPRRVKVSVKIDGMNMFCSGDTAREYNSKVDRWCHGEEVDEKDLKVTSRFVGKMLHTMEQVHSCGAPAIMSSRLSTKALIENTLASMDDDERATLHFGNVTFKPPRLDAVPLRDDRVQVVCTAEGSLSESVDAWRGLLSNTRRCAVCFSDYNSAAWVTCKNSDCDVSIHVACLDGAESKEEAWQCYMCSTSQRNDTSPQCLLCGFQGGPCHGTTRGTDFVHQTCDVWCDGPKASGNCALCGESYGVVIACAARGCQVGVHPMCAGITSTIVDHNRDSFASEDEYLCSQYTLGMVRVGAQDGRESPRLVPVVYCGFHNSRRSTELQGLYVDGSNLEGAMEVYERKSASM